MTKTTINFESDAFTDVDDTSLQALADKCKSLEKVENNIEVAESLLKELGHPRFRAIQILKWIHQKYCFDFGKMSNLPLKFRQDLSTQFTIALPEINSEYHSKD